jgi:hypothetical protein
MLTEIEKEQCIAEIDASKAIALEECNEDDEPEPPSCQA